MLGEVVILNHRPESIVNETLLLKDIVTRKVCRISQANEALGNYSLAASAGFFDG
jgi:hypothetical protein